MRALTKADCEDSFLEFVRTFWHVNDPATPFVEGWPLQAIAEHLEAVTDGTINRLLINVPPGSTKSLACNVLWPAWEWGPRNLAHYRYVTFSYAAALTERDNGRFRDVLQDQEYQAMWGDRFTLRKVGETKVENSRTGWKIASSVGGVSTGERGDRVLLDDPHSVKEAESDVVRKSTIEWFTRSMSNRLNDMQRSAIVIIMQRVHELDVSGYILAKELGYEHLMIPAEYDPRRHCETTIGWSDPRTLPGENYWPERIPDKTLSELKTTMGDYGYSGQYLQSPEPPEGGIFKKDWWQSWDFDYAQRLGLTVARHTNTSFPFPPFEFVIASLDTAYGEKKENDWSALTVLGVWRNEHDMPKVMVVHNWQHRLPLHMPEPTAEELIGLGITGKTTATERRRILDDAGKLGLVDKVQRTCERCKVNKLIIEDKASGKDVQRELRRLFGDMPWSVQLVNAIGDKVARAFSVSPYVAAGLVYMPSFTPDIGPTWADDLITEMATFPKAAHDDRSDATIHALRHLREMGMITFPHEVDAIRAAQRQPPGAPVKLYPAMGVGGAL